MTNMAEPAELEALVQFPSHYSFLATVSLQIQKGFQFYLCLMTKQN